MSIGCCEWAEWLGEQTGQDAAVLRAQAARVRRLTRAKRMPAATRAVLLDVVSKLRAQADSAGTLAREWSEFEG